MRNRDSTTGSATPHPEVVGRALSSLNRHQRSPGVGESTRLCHHAYGRRAIDTCVAFESEYGVSTQLPFWYSPESGEVFQFQGQVPEQQMPDTALNEKVISSARGTLDRFKSEVIAWRSRLAAHHAAGLIRRLEYILEDEPEIGPKQMAPSPDSFSVLLAYLARHPEFKTPSIGYNRDGTFSAVWKGGEKLRLTLDFISPTSIRWIYVDSRKGIQDSITGAGTVSLEILSGVIASYGASSWMKA